MMSNEKSTDGIRLQRDNQQWVFDYLIKETGRVYHFQPDGRGDLPTAVRSHAMISKHVGMAARKQERIAQAEDLAGHDVTAGAYYFRAALQFMAAQHVIFQNNDEKKYLHGSLQRCYAKVIERAPYRIEHVDVEWEGQTVSGLLHLAPGDEPKPLIFFVPGCDVTKEVWPNPQLNQALDRGMHVFSFDGPGQGESNLRGIALHSDSYERAASVVIDKLVDRPEIDADRIGVYGISFGSFWGLRIAANDSRVKAVAAPWATYCSLYYLMAEESPRFKQLFAYLTQASSEEELDAIANEMTLDGYLSEISCPTLLIAGEYDPRSPLEEIYRLREQITAPAELWVFPDQFHHTSLGGGGRRGLWEADIHETICDWLSDRFADKPMPNAGTVSYIEGSSAGPNDPKVSRHLHWYE
jgi:pimeloyl-ACP methyl ester carboxylesterase